MLVVAVSGATAQNATISSSPTGYITRGILMYEGENYNGAIDQLSHALQSPLSLDEKEQAEYFIAKSYFKKGDSNRALHCLNSFAAKHPSSFYSHDVLASIGDIYFFNNDFDAAIAAYSKVNRNALPTLQKEDVTYRLGYSYLRTHSGDIDSHRKQAEALFQSITGSAKYNHAYKFYKAYIDYEAGRYDSAFEGFNTIDRNSELGYNAQYYMCQIYFLKGNNSKAISLGKALLTNSTPNVMNTEMSRIVGEANFLDEEYDNAYKYITQYISSTDGDPAMSAKYVLGVLNYRNAEYDKAIQSLSDVAQENDILGQSAYYHLGQAYRRQNNLSMAAMAFEKAANMNFSKETKESAFYNYAVAHASGARTPSSNAIDKLEGFLNRYPNSKYSDAVSEYLAAIYVNGNDYSKALESINRIKSPSKEIETAKQIVLYNLGVNALSNDQTDKAQNYFTQARKLAKYNRNIDSQVSLWLGECAYRKGDLNQAAKYQNEYLKAVNKSDSNYGLGYFNLGYTRYQQHKYDDARNAFTKAISSNQLSKANTNDANNRIGDTYYYGGNFKTAQKYYEKSSGDYAQFQKAMMLGYQKDYSGKVQHIKTLIKNYPSSPLIPMAMLEQGDTYVTLNESDKAVNTYDQLISKFPENIHARKAMLSKAITERNMKNEASAISTYKQIIAKYPTSEEAHMALEDLKLIYAARGELHKVSEFVGSIANAPQLDVNEMDRLAFDAAEKAYIDDNNDISKIKNYLKTYPNGAFVANANYYIAKYHYNNGNYDEAIEVLNSIEKACKDSSFAEDILAMKASILTSQGKHEEALITFKELEVKTTTADNRLSAQLGVLRSANKLNYYATIVDYANKLLDNGALTAEEDKEIRFGRAFAQYKQGNNDEASKNFAELAPNTNSIYGAQAAYYLAEVQFNTNQLSKAETTLNTFIDAGTEHEYWLARAFILLADVYHKQGNSFEATEYLESLKNNYPGKNDDIFELIESRLSKWNQSKSKN